MKHIFLLKPVFGIFLIQWLLFAACQKNDPVVNPVSNEIRLGAILDLSGLYSEEGKAGKAVTDAVISDINQRYQSVGSPVRFSVIYKDSGLDSIKSLAAVKELYNAGVRLLVAGPSTSADLKSIRPFIEANNILVLTCFSSAPALAIPGDNIFRIITDDNVQGRATAKMMQTDGIRAIVPVWCDDTYGNGLQETVKQHFMASGGVVYNGVKYTTGSVTFSSVLQNASEQVAEASKEFGADKVGVLLISFQDASDFFKAASTISELSSVRWYGCDANTKKVAVTDNPEAAAFALKVRFVAPIMAIGTASSVPAVARSLAARVKAVTGSDPDDMALSAYDAVMIYGQCYNLAQSSDVAVIKTLLPSVCASYNYLVSRQINYET